MAETPQNTPDSSREVLQYGKEVLRNEGDINGQLKDRLKNLQKVIKAHEDINAKIKASEELGKDIKELDLDIYKNLRERVKIENELNKLQSDSPQILSRVLDIKNSIQKNIVDEKQAQSELNRLKQDLLQLETANVELVDIVQRKKEELQKSIIKENELENKIKALREESGNLTNKQKRERQEALVSAERGLNALKSQITLQKESFTEEENSYLILQKQVKEADKKLGVIQSSIVAQQESLTTEEATALALLQSLELNQKTNDALKKREAMEALIAKRMGISGNIIKGAYGVLNKLGIGSFMNLAAVTQKMQLAAQDGASKTKVLLIGLKASAQALGDALTDPLTIMGGIVKLLKFIYDSAVGYQSKMFEAGKNLGVNVTQATQLFKTFQGIATSNGTMALTARQLVDTYAQLNNQLGFMGPYNQEFLTTTAGIQRRIGASAEEMQSFQFYSVATGKSLQQSYASIIGSAKAQGARLKLSMSEKQIMEGISKVSATIFNNFKGNIKQLGEAVVKATKLGLTLDQVQSASYSLLDFESSISKEFEAQLLTGKNINLSRARQLALTGSTEELMEEMTSQLGTQADWNKMNVLQQQSLAEAMGMSKEAVDEMYKKQQLVAVLGDYAGASSQTQYEQLKKQNYTHDQIAALIGDQAAGDILRASVQEKMAATMERIRETIGQMTERFLPLIEKFADFISDTENLKKIFVGISSVIGGIVGYSIALSVQRKQQLADEINSRIVQTQLLATMVMQNEAKAAGLVTDKAILATQAQQEATAATQLTTSAAQNVQEQSRLVTEGGILTTENLQTAAEQTQLTTSVAQNVQEKSRFGILGRILGLGRANVAVKQAENLQTNAAIAKSGVLQTKELVLTETKIVGAGASATAGAGYLGPLALGVGAAVISGLMAYLATSGGGSGGGGMQTPTVEAPQEKIEPVNTTAESMKTDQSRRLAVPTSEEVKKYYVVIVDPLTGNKIERQVTKEYYESQGGALNER